MEWISVKDRLPEEQVTVLMILPYDEVPMPAFLNDGQWYLDPDITDNLTEYHIDRHINTSYLWDFEVPIYWMPLPQPPKQK